MQKKKNETVVKTVNYNNLNFLPSSILVTRMGASNGQRGGQRDAQKAVLNVFLWDHTYQYNYSILCHTVRKIGFLASFGGNICYA